MLLHAKSLAPWLVALAVVLAVGVFAAPPTHKKRATVIDRTGPPEPVSPSRRRYDEPRPYESHCVHQGGVCRYVRDCPKGMLTSVKGLCPDQQKNGVECCYARPSYQKSNRKSRNSQYRRHHRQYNNKNKSFTPYNKNKYWN